MSLILTEMDAGSWVIFELPGFTTAASGTEQRSLDELRTATDTSYFKDKDARRKGEGRCRKWREAPRWPVRVA